MEARNDEPDTGQMHDLIVALAGADTTVAGSLDLCERLWCSSRHQPWLSAAMIRKLALPSLEPDAACQQFLAAKAHEVLQAPGLSALPDQGQIARLLPAVILLLPMESWSDPVSLWNRLLEALRLEFGLPQATVESGPMELDQASRDLAKLLVDAIGARWTPSLNERLEAWRGHPYFCWLVALRRVIRLDELLTAARQKESLLVDDPRLAQRMAAISPFERRRVVLLRQAVTGETIWPQPDPVVDLEASAIQWRFAIPLKTSARLEVVVGGKVAGILSLLRASEQEINIEKAEGICEPLLSHGAARLAVARAAATDKTQSVALTDRVSSALEATPEGVILHLWWGPRPGGVK